jgi:CHAT domain-containing protein
MMKLHTFRDVPRFLCHRALLLTVLLAAPALANEPGTTSDALQSGQSDMAYGNFAGAVQTFERAARRAAETHDQETQLRALQALAEAQQALGASDQAVVALTEAIALAETRSDARWKALLQAQLGSTHLQSGHMDKAQPLLIAALETARSQKNPAFIAAVQNDLGLLLREANDSVAARDAFAEARRLAQAAHNSPLTLRVLLNAASLELAMREPDRAREMARAAQQHARQLEAQPYLLIQGLIRSGLLLSEIAQQDPHERQETYLSAHAALRDALQQAETLQDPRLISAASGSLGNVYQLTNHQQEALALTQKAILSAQRAGASELLFRWHWQAARLHRAQRDLDMAIASYRLALAAYETSNLSPVSADFTLFPSEPSHAVFLEQADLLLQKSSALGNSSAAQAYLVEARDAVEILKARELQDYFHDTCVAEARTRVKALIQNIGTGTAVLYPIVLPDRLELLVNIGPVIKRFTVAVKESVVVETARQFREAVQSQRTRAYLAPAQTLYQWLIRPIESSLMAAQVKTLVTIPDHALRAIPMAALYDGNQFIVNRLAMVMAPGLELTDPRPLPTKAAKMLLAGLSESVQGYPALTHVSNEMDNINDLRSGRILKNKTFVREQLEQELTQEHYSIAHIASHGEFTGDVRNSFILAYDGKISMNDLTRFIGFNRLRDDPLDLLTLSACQTAAGDERAMLGLAGITVKAGARSALASLWPIHDEATSLLMTEFYRQLQMPGVSKALALQRAQQKLAAITRYRHPGYWSGFVLIGNWL